MDVGITNDREGKSASLKMIGQSRWDIQSLQPSRQKPEVVCEIEAEGFAIKPPSNHRPIIPIIIEADRLRPNPSEASGGVGPPGRNFGKDQRSRRD
jgi:hypothetical protein